MHENALSVPGVTLASLAIWSDASYVYRAAAKNVAK